MNYILIHYNSLHLTMVSHTDKVHIKRKLNLPQCLTKCHARMMYLRVTHT